MWWRQVAQETLPEEEATHLLLAGGAKGPLLEGIVEYRGRRTYDRRRVEQGSREVQGTATFGIHHRYEPEQLRAIDQAIDQDQQT